MFGFSNKNQDDDQYEEESSEEESGNDKVDNQYEYLTDQERRDEWQAELAQSVLEERRRWV